jgi:hypothetical protein
VADRFDGRRDRFDLEDPDDIARLTDPKLALAPLRGFVVFDEIQRRPDLFPVLSVLVDQWRRTRCQGRHYLPSTQGRLRRGTAGWVDHTGPEHYRSTRLKGQDHA